jgi:hypothetical protein
MTPEQAAWVRDHVWPTELARTRYRNEHLCSCTWPCPCEKGQHHYCGTPDGTPAVDVLVAVVWGSIHTAYTLSGILQHRQRRANVLHLPQQRPCRQLCQCQHPFHTGQSAVPKEGPEQKTPSKPTTAPVRRPRPLPAGQLGLFEEVAP